MPRRGPSSALLCLSLFLGACDESASPEPIEVAGAHLDLPATPSAAASEQDPDLAATSWRELPPRHAPAGAVPFERGALDDHDPRTGERVDPTRPANDGADPATPPNIDPNAPPPDAPTLTAQERVIPPPTLDLLELLDAGGEPREPLRVSLTPGTIERVQLDLVVAVDADAEGGAPPEIPPMRFLAVEKVLAGAASGTELEIGLERFEIVTEGLDDPAGAQAAAVGMEGIERHTMRLTLSDRGRITASTLVVPDGVTAQAAESFRGFTDALLRTIVTFPEEAVGVGARWSVTEAIAENGVSLQQINVYELTARQGDLLTIAVTTTRTPRQEFIVPDQAPPGLRLHIVDLASAGGGSLELARGSFAARAGKLDSRTQIEVEILQDEEVLQRIKSVMSMTISATPK